MAIKEIDMADKNVPNIGIPDEILHGSRQDVESFASKQVMPQVQPTGGSAPAAVPVLPPKNMSAIEDLLLFGSLRYEASVLNMRFTVKTLTVADKEASYGAVAHLPATSFVHFSNLRDELLARAVETVNGLPLESYFKSEGPVEHMTTMDKRVGVIKKMHGPIVDKIYELYNILEDKASRALLDVNFDDIKNS